MRGINRIVQSVIDQEPIYSMMLSTGVVNYTKLASKISPYVNALAGERVRINTIVKALSTVKTEDHFKEIVDILKEADMSVDFRYMERLKCGKFVPGENVLIAYRKNNCWKVIEGDPSGELALVRITLPPEAAGKPGLTLFLVQYLAVYDLHVEKIYRFDTDILLMCSYEIVDQVVRYLRDLIFLSYK